MPRIKPLDEYPDSYFDTFRLALKVGKVDVPCESGNEARNIRSHLYTFRSVLAQSDHELAEPSTHLTFKVNGKTLEVETKKLVGETQLQGAINDTNNQT